MLASTLRTDRVSTSGFDSFVGAVLSTVDTHIEHGLIRFFSAVGDAVLDDALHLIGVGGGERLDSLANNPFDRTPNFAA